MLSFESIQAVKRFPWVAKRFEQQEGGQEATRIDIWFLIVG